MKWQFCIESKEDDKYLVYNSDEGDHGAFMNRSLLESDPHSILDIIIAAYAIGVVNAYHVDWEPNKF
jgi:NADH:ubiquinone oxidoreductase subunit F (NADH-binding)